MSKEMIISSNGHETRVAILEDDQVAEIFIERERQRGVVGNLYKGRVSKVLPGMQSAFVDLGLERDGVPLRYRRSRYLRGVDRLETDDDEPTGPSNGPGPTRAPRRDRPMDGSRPVQVPAGDAVAATGTGPPEAGREARKTGRPNPKSKSC